MSPRATAPATPEHPDAGLIRLCAEHVVNHRAYNAGGGTADRDNDPLWHAYMATHDALTAAEPQTMEGMLAKARAAKAEELTDREQTFCASAHEWAWNLMNDLLRLYGGGSA